MTIEELPRYERLPGEYFVYQVEDDPHLAAGFLAEFGTAFAEGRDVVLSPNQYRETRLRYGDYVTFRQCADCSNAENGGRRMSYRVQVWNDDAEQPGWVLLAGSYPSREEAQRAVDESGRADGYAILKARYETVKLVSPGAMEDSGDVRD